MNNTRQIQPGDELLLALRTEGYQSVLAVEQDPISRFWLVMDPEGGETWVAPARLEVRQ